MYSVNKLVRRAPAGAALIAAGLTALVHAPWTELAAFPVGAAMLWLPAFCVCTLFRPLDHAIRNADSRRERIATSVLVGLVCFTPGALLSNLLLIDGSLQGPTMMGYALSALMSLLASYAFARLGGSRIGFRDALAAIFAFSAVSLGLVDALVWPDRYGTVHLVLTGVTLALFSGFAWAIERRRKLFLALWSLPLALSVLAVPGFVTHGLEGVVARSVARFTLHRRLLLIARSLMDGDRDGFSAALGGGDCDDDDPYAFPLALRGRDCLSWGKAANSSLASFVPASTNDQLALSDAPRLVLLVTVDALRCVGDRLPELRDSCPNIRKLGKEGRLRLDAHTSYPATRNAFGSLHTASACFMESASPRFLLADWMAEQGFRTHVVSTHPNQLPGPVRASFQTIDDSLVAPASAATSVTSEHVTDRGLAYLRSNLLPDRPPLFLWLHYFDAHAPYVQTPGSSWVMEPEIVRYAREVRRIDSAIARLLRDLRAMPEASSTIMLLTADHGEEFGEKGFHRHGSSIYEEAIRIPMLVWSPDQKRLLRMPSTLPANHAEVAPFLRAVLTNAEFTSADETFFWVHSPDTTAFGLYHRGRKLIYSATDNRLELFDLREDPFERTNLSPTEPHLIRELAPRLLSHLTRCETATSVPYRSSGLLQTRLSSRTNW